ncbi:MAG: response regulator transcription factor, partial [Bacteroidales bacterium]|nr:response regulator transcription factor [Bacteroidales bacterium]
RILLVDDEPDILEFLSYNISKAGYEVFTALNGKKALEVAAEKIPHLILLDVMMPEMDGIETCEELRRTPLHENTLIVFLTARSEDYSQIAGFTAGADDYITKPVRPKVLLSRIAALLRRIKHVTEIPGASSIVTLSRGSLVIDKERFVVLVEGTELSLPKKEFELLNLLMSHPGKVFSRDEIYSRVWGSSAIVGERTIDVHIRKLREKLGGKYIRTTRGVGYKYVNH